MLRFGQGHKDHKSLGTPALLMVHLGNYMHFKHNEPCFLIGFVLWLVCLYCYLIFKAVNIYVSIQECPCHCSVECGYNWATTHHQSLV